MTTTETTPLHLVGTLPVQQVLPAGAIYKATDHRGRPHFVQPTQFVFSDGSQAAYPITARRRMDLPSHLNLMHDLARQGRLQAGVQAGHVVKTVTSIG